MSSIQPPPSQGAVVAWSAGQVMTVRVAVGMGEGLVAHRGHAHRSGQLLAEHAYAGVDRGDVAKDVRTQRDPPPGGGVGGADGVEQQGGGACLGCTVTVVDARGPEIDLLVSDVYKSQFDRFDMTPEKFVSLLRAGGIEARPAHDGGHAAVRGRGQLQGGRDGLELLLHLVELVLQLDFVVDEQLDALARAELARGPLRGVALGAAACGDTLLDHRAILEAIASHDQAGARAAMRAHLDGHAPAYEADYRARHTDGRWVWLSSRGKVVQFSKDGAPQRMVGTLMDISGRKQAEATLQTQTTEGRVSSGATSKPTGKCKH